MFWEACGSELMGVYFEDGEEGVCVIIGRIPGRGRVHREGRCEGSQIW